MFGYPGACRIVEFERDGVRAQLGFEFDHELVHDAHDRVHLQRRELDDRVEAIAELGRERLLDDLHAIGRVILLREADRSTAHLLRPGVRRHHQDHVAKIGLAAVVVGERPVVHHLQQQVENLRMRFLDLVEQHHGVRVLADRLGQQAALVEADVSRRCADEARHRVAFHVLGHVETNQFDTEAMGQLARDLGLAHAGRAGEQERTDGLVFLAQARARHLDGPGQRLDGPVLAEDRQLEVALQRSQHILVGRRDALGRNSRHLGDDILDHFDGHGIAPVADRNQAQVGAGLVHDVDGLVGQMTVIDVTRGQLDRGFERGRLVADAMVFLEPRFQAIEDGHRFRDGRLRYIYFLETSRKCMIFLENPSVFTVGGRTDTADLTVGQHRLDQVARVHHPARSGTRANHRMDLVDEQDRPRVVADFGDHALEALLEITAVLGTGNQGAHVERVDRAVAQYLGHALLDDHACESLGQRGLADAGLADVQRIVLAAAAENLDGALDLEFAADQGVDFPFDGALIEVGRVLLER